MTIIAHISDLHVSHTEFDEDVFFQAVDEINNLQPDMIVLTGDLTDQGYYRDYLLVKDYLSRFESPLFAVPGNHDSRNLGHQTFEELIGERSWKLTKDDDFVVIGLDSSTPDVDSGNIGRPQQLWMDHILDDCVVNERFSVVALHHHVIPIPETGRERNVLSDAGDILKTLVNHEVDMVLAGHKHVPNIWKMNNTLFVNAGSLCSKKLRGKDTNSYNTYFIDDDSIKVVLNRVAGDKILLGEYPRNIL